MKICNAVLIFQNARYFGLTFLLGFNTLKLFYNNFDVFCVFLNDIKLHEKFMLLFRMEVFNGSSHGSTKKMTLKKNKNWFFWVAKPSFTKG